MSSISAASSVMSSLGVQPPKPTVVQQQHSAAFLVVYPGKTIEVYTFLIDRDGKKEYMYASSRSGDEVMITKASVMRGDCQLVALDLIK